MPARENLNDPGDPGVKTIRDLDALRHVEGHVEAIIVCRNQRGPFVVQMEVFRQPHRRRLTCDSR
ncbi:MAG TPA: hypothetical protein VFY73_15285 [Ideonella sp.]|uniref:hypothetical protein n=1 Tax=Ideonella sp. TaxID=1929293 RepID=UPI002E32AC03|nr:hypothetical protein [Ideonella sp.]HEX5685385.1 hypothetical protein [Ideonella sp.]